MQSGYGPIHRLDTRRAFGVHGAMGVLRSPWRSRVAMTGSQLPRCKSGALQTPGVTHVSRGAATIRLI